MTQLKRRARSVQDALVAAGLECHAVFRIEPEQLVQLTGGKVLDIS